MMYIFLMALILSPLAVLASPAEEKEEFRISMLDKVQEMFGARMNFAANRLDSFFATDRADDELGRSRVRIQSRYTLRKNFSADQENIYRINLKLPHLEEKFKYDYYQVDDKKKKNKEQKSNSSSETTRIDDRDRINRGWIFNADVGVSAAVPPRLTVRGRLRRNFRTGTLINRFVEQITYVTDERGFVHDTSLTSDHVFHERLLFRFINSIIWRITSDDFDTQHGPTFLHQMTDNDAFNYGAFVYTTEDNDRYFLSNYQVRVNYRRNLYRQWIYMDLVPGVNFPKEFSFSINPFFIVQLEVLLGH